MKTELIRLATADDAESILSIYAPYVTGTSITFEYEVPSLDEMRSRITDTLKEYPYLVYLLNDKVAGFAYAHRLRERIAYQWDAELSVYVDGVCHQRGIGKALYACLMDLLKLQHVINVSGVVTLPNPASERLHEHFGFRLAGVLHNTGFKNGKWLDVAWYEKNLSDWPAKPQPLLSFPKVDQAEVQNILEAFAH